MTEVKDDENKAEPSMPMLHVLRRLAGYMRPYKYFVWAGFALMLGASFLRAVPTMVVRRAFNEMSERASSLVMGDFLLLGGVYFGVHLLGAVIGYVHRLATAKPAQGMIRDLRNQVFGHLQSLSLKFYDNRQTGELMSRVLNDVDRLERGFVESFLQIVNSVLTFGFQLAFMLYISVELTLAALCVIPFMIYFTARFNTKAHLLFRGRREKMADVTTVVQENISGIRVVKSFCREDYEQEKLRRETDSYFDYGIKTARMLGFAINLMTVLGASAGAIALAYGGSLVLAERIETGDLVAMVLYTGMLYEPVYRLVHGNYHMQQSGVSAHRVFELLDTQPEIADAPDAVAMPDIRGHVEFQDVTFSYDGGPPVLENVSLEARPGEMVALVGRSGAGKTSVVGLIPRLYDVSSGAVLIDGEDVRRLRNADLRRNISMVMQDVFLFNGSIRQNIAYGRLDATDEEIVAAAQAAHVDEFVNELPDKYETEIGERGVKLSGGQRQRIAVARAILADAAILLLDEPTSNVDTHSERLIQEALEKLMHERTTFVIAHRLSTVINAGKIVLLERGKVQAVGTHGQLLRNSPLYAYLYNVQMQSNDEE